MHTACCAPRAVVPNTSPDFEDMDIVNIDNDDTDDAGARRRRRQRNARLARWAFSFTTGDKWMCVRAYRAACRAACSRSTDGARETSAQCCGSWHACVGARGRHAIVDARHALHPRAARDARGMRVRGCGWRVSVSVTRASVSVTRVSIVDPGQYVPPGSNSLTRVKEQWVKPTSDLGSRRP